MRRDIVGEERHDRQSGVAPERVECAQAFPVGLSEPDGDQQTVAHRGQLLQKQFVMPEGKRMAEQDQIVAFAQNGQVLFQHFHFRRQNVVPAGDRQNGLAAGINDDAGVFHRLGFAGVFGGNDIDRKDLPAGHGVVPLQRGVEFLHDFAPGRDPANTT